MQDLTSGFAKDLFVEWAEDEKNSVIFSTRTAPGSLGRRLIENPNTAKVEVEVMVVLAVLFSTLGQTYCFLSKTKNS